MKKRMYFFVLYSLSPIQKGIQAGHAALEYANLYDNMLIFVEFFHNDKTWIILDGGTSNSTLNENNVPCGTLNQIENELNIRNVRFSSFREPDLEDALTAICFIVDERVWDHEKYPNFNDIINGDNVNLQNQILSYDDWVLFLGGENNVFLRELLKNKKISN
jgi:hypothetical protein